MKQLLVVTGLSGAGRSTAAGVLDDLGWFVIDNLPAALVPKVAELAGSKGGRYDRVGLVMSGYDHEMEAAVESLRSQVDRVVFVFLDASTDVLVRRYESTKRRHPLSDGSLVDAITKEVELLAQAKTMADLVIDTSDMNPHQLRERLSGEFASSDESDDMRISVSSFGFKHGVPLDVDMVIDCRFLPNPYWDEELRPFSGQDTIIQSYVLEREQTERFLDRLMALLDELLPAYSAEGRSYLSIAFGCTGGRHRSVAVAETVSASLTERGWLPRVNHRDISR
ncbi:MAG: UPF0042 nucleotide-binding protein [Acidimicrobiales bacterium]